ncbi:MAG TPA: lipocalin family protein [Dissulfurispiraceae bacterium]|nr:lipocalin family protein [Dissulfurispiraceae bacterium]
MNRVTLLFMAVLIVLLSACSSAPPKATVPDLQTVSHVDLKRYAGTWYEIARYPNSFERGCIAVSATYFPLLNGNISVVNQCRKERMDGELITAEGTLKVVDRVSNAKLRISFFWLRSGDYWIIELDKNYGYAVIGNPERSYLWILSRTPHMKPETYAYLLDRLRDVHQYDVRRLQTVFQPD